MPEDGDHSRSETARNEPGNDEPLRFRLNRKRRPTFLTLHNTCYRTLRHWRVLLFPARLA